MSGFGAGHPSAEWMRLVMRLNTCLPYELESIMQILRAKQNQLENEWTDSHSRIVDDIDRLFAQDKGNAPVGEPSAPDPIGFTKETEMREGGRSYGTMGSDHFASEPSKSPPEESPNVPPWPSSSAPPSGPRYLSRLERIQRYLGELQVPEREGQWWVGWTIFAILTVGITIGSVFAWFLIVVGDGKPFKGACFNNEDMANHFCFFAAGQFAYGFITVGQVAMGVINVSQAGVGLLFAVGQGQAGIGWTVGQVAVGFYVRAAQVGMALWKVKVAMIGYNLAHPWFGGRTMVTCEGEDEDSVSSATNCAPVA